MGNYRNKYNWDQDRVENMYNRWMYLVKQGKPTEWKNFEEVLRWCKATYEPGTSLYRIDEAKPYGPTNCEWKPMTNSVQYRKHLADQKRQVMLWEAVVALNRRFGFAEKRAMDFMETLDEVNNELRRISKEDGRYVATENLRKEVSRISGMEVKLIHMDEIKRAREENEAKGVYFPEEDQDVKEWW